LQELQRLQEEQTGKKRTEKLEWMYSTPATGTSQNPNDLEDYLLGKKRVDKILTADENAKVSINTPALMVPDTDVLCNRLVLLTRTSSLFRTRTMLATLRLKYEKIPYSPSSNKSRLPIKPSCPTPSVCERCKNVTGLNRRRTRRTRSEKRMRERGSNVSAGRRGKGIRDP